MSRLSACVRREWPSLILGAVVVVLILNCLIAPPGVKDLIVLRAHRMRLEAALKRVEAENRDLGTSVQKLRSDDRYLERMIRIELGFTRPDELVYRFAGASAGSDR